MKHSILFIMVVLSFYATTPSLAQKAIRQSETSSKPKSFFEAGFWDNWFVGLSGGVACYMGEEDRKNPDGFLHRLTPNIKLSAGKWLRPSYGLRLQTEGVWLAGWNNGLDFETIYTWNKLVYDNTLIHDRVLDFNPRRDKKGIGYYQDMRYMDLHLDFMVNLINLWREYNTNRPIDVIVYLGSGWAHVIEHKGIPSFDGIVVKAGSLLNIRLSDRLNGNVELQGSAVSESFDGQIGGRGMSQSANRFNEGYASLTAGLSYRLQNNFTRYEFIDPEIVKELNERVNGILADNTQLQEKINNYCPPDSCNQLKRQLQEALSKECKDKLHIVIQYVIDKWNVRSSELYKLEEIVDFMTKHPEISISVTGYADAMTANPAYNRKLSERRAMEIVWLLTRKYGIEKNRIKANYVGDTVQPFKINERNRAVITFSLDE